ncbi:pyridoxal-phosphate dependent enzyme [Clostridium algoriphilum]|uniref:PLP-dependent cysteine synthase family protein n=1 Tax=Clostridium algoriphilum TaxID=198347 RepID=UPI001CF266B4|nr:pyridoxal-phosphate dependent enzyme [Clostridium algoriphilum]MCB2293271.1 pyridoxal-phosphate dependent enzyme [Clostridium algoriphilum]
MSKKLVWGPTFEEMLNPETIRTDIREKALKARIETPLDPINLFNINWTDSNGNMSYMVIPKELTGVSANIIVMYSKNFPTGSHKVGATYSVTMEKQLSGEIIPGKDTIVFPSTGNYGIGGSWTGPRMGYTTKVILPELMSKERFEKIEYYGATYIKTSGCESSVKEIYDKCWELKAASPNNKIMNQFESFGNYLFHYHVTGNSINKVVSSLKEKGIGNGKVSALVSSMGSSGTIASGDRLKQLYPETKIIGLEPVQCPTLYCNGFGDHDIQGIGDKHVTWIHNVMNMDAMICIDDMESKKGLQLLTSDIGKKYLIDVVGMSKESVSLLSQILGISGVCNLIGAIKTAKYYEMTENDNIFTICTDTIDRYHSVMDNLDNEFGTMNKTEAAVRYNCIFKNIKLDYIQEGTYAARKRWHNLKYYTWVEQQGKTAFELNAQKSQDYWMEKQNQIKSIDHKLKQARGF